MKTSALYVVFDEKLGPVTQTWLPEDIPSDVIDKIPMLVMNIASNMQELPKGVAIIPVPGHGMKSLVSLIRYESAKLRAGTGEVAIVLLFEEADDAIVYRYLKQFEDVFEKYSTIAKEFQEKKPTRSHAAKMLGDFHLEIRNLLDVLEKEEGADEAFPSDAVTQDLTPFKCKIVVVGDPGVGKTSLVIQFTEKAFRKTYLPTIGVNITEKTITCDNNQVTMVLWDIAGQSKFTKMRKHFYSGAGGILLVFDLTDKKSLTSVKAWYEDIKNSLVGIPLNCILLGNKNDDVDNRIIDNEEASAFAASLGLSYFETSAKTGQNVQEVFDLFAKTVIKGAGGNSS